MNFEARMAMFARESYGPLHRASIARIGYERETNEKLFFKNLQKRIDRGPKRRA